ncbi:MAG: dihydrolipoyllysine-residue acetyltransferase [Luminiphilus sp.]|jgi:pyruvate dehydrogenase E2 component (dihydrolipoamide acetyltransferase)
MAEQLIKVPDIGGAEGAEVVEVLVAVGDVIELEQSLIVVESDKASMEIPASSVGTVTELRVAVGDAVSEGDVILVLATEGAASTPAQVAPEPEPETAIELPEPSASPAQTADAEATNTSSPAPGEVTSIPVRIPDLGSDQGADLVEILVPVGTMVAEGDSLVLLESDKASMEVPAPAAGVIIEWLVGAGETVQEGVVIATLQVSAPATSSASGTQADAHATEAQAREALAPATASASPERSTQDDADTAIRPSAAVPPTEGGGAVYAGPAVRKLAREFGVALERVSGTGARGRILKEDLQQYVARALAGPEVAAGTSAGLPTVPEVDFARFGPVERTARARIDKLTASNMVRSWLNVPHVTQFDDADISDLEQFRKALKAEAEQRGLRLSPLPFIIKACALALADHPKLKASLADGGETLVMKDYCHIGMAVDSPGGLVVPVIRDVDKKSIWTLASEITALAAKARDKQLKPDEMQGGVFTVSSLGAIGGRGFTPIINTPEVGILGVGRAAIQPVWDGAAFQPRSMLPLALSYDHRVVNGGDGGRFLSALIALLADVRRMVM